jgi:hypothetical protein
MIFPKTGFPLSGIMLEAIPIIGLFTIPAAP